MAEQGENKPAAIKITGGSNITVRDNVSIGMPVLEATDVNRLDAAGNVAVMPTTEPELYVPKRLFGLPRWGWAFVGAVAASVIAGGLLHWLGWV